MSLLDREGRWRIGLVPKVGGAKISRPDGEIYLHPLGKDG